MHNIKEEEANWAEKCYIGLLSFLQYNSILFFVSMCFILSALFYLIMYLFVAVFVCSFVTAFVISLLAKLVVLDQTFCIFCPPLHFRRLLSDDDSLLQYVSLSKTGEVQWKTFGERAKTGKSIFPVIC